MQCGLQINTLQSTHVWIVLSIQHKYSSSQFVDKLQAVWKVASKHAGWLCIFFFFFIRTVASNQMDSAVF